MNVTVRHHDGDKKEFNPVVSTMWAANPFRRDNARLRIYTYQGLSFAQHLAIESAICKIHNEIPIKPLDKAPKLRSNRHGIYWEASVTIDEDKVPTPTFDPRQCCPLQRAFAVPMKEAGWKEGEWS